MLRWIEVSLPVGLFLPTVGLFFLGMLPPLQQAQPRLASGAKVYDIDSFARSARPNS